MAIIQLFSALLVTILANFVASEYSSENCTKLGYTKSELTCSKCDTFEEFGLQSIKNDCDGCCTKDDYDATAKRYPKAILEVCTCKFGAYPQIQAFIKSDKPKKYSRLEIKYVRGLDPVLKMIDENGDNVENLDIHKWDTDTVDEFLQTHLIKD